MFHPSPSPSQPRRAFTLIEMVIVLVITGMVLGGIWAGTAIAIGNAKEKTFISGVLTTVANARDYIRQRGSIVGIGDSGSSSNNMLAFAQAAYPPDIANKPAAMASTVAPFFRNNYSKANTGTSTSGITYVIALGDFSGVGPAIDLVHLGIPPRACVDLLFKSLAGSVEQMQTMGLAAFSVKNTGGSSGLQTVPVTLATATSFCGSGATENSMFLIFRP